MEQKAKMVLILSACVIGTTVIASYSYYQSKEYFKGPQINIVEPENGKLFESPVVIILGKTENVAFLTLNDAPLPTDQKGNFGVKLLLLPGYNIFTLRAQDRFGKTLKKTLELVYQKPFDTYKSTSTSSPTL